MPTCCRRSPPACPAGVTVLVVPTPPEIGDAYGVPADEACRAAGAARAGTPSSRRSAPTTQPPKLVARQHDLHLGHDRPAQGRAARPPSTPEQQAGATGEIGEHFGIVAEPAIVVLMNGPMYHSAPDAYGSRRARTGLRRRAAAALRRRGAAAADRAAQGHAHAHRADHVRAPAAAAGGGEARSTTCRRCASSCTAPRPARRRSSGDDRVVGTGHQRVLRRDRDRHRGLAQFGRGAAQARHGRPRASRAARCASSTSRAATLPPGEIGEIYLRSRLCPTSPTTNDDAKRREIGARRPRDGRATSATSTRTATCSCATASAT